MHKTLVRQGNAALIAGVLVVLMAAGLFKLLWMYIHAPIVWVVLIAWVILPFMPFVIRLFSLRQMPVKREVDGIC